ncbi:DUF2637 domain-containing protein [Streptomyces xiamenensis]|uniref:Transmembrane protein n=1 Tax=Streptomyces xiamenensis TaxID=408015 RepID=A0A0F7FZ50_9ACTN|nr:MULTISPECIES: DUF2637 domain-containing protein [Streptomyces]AKG46083.1 transmembrane protein [Streptomyces xiamenensis]MCU4746444.1 DUF2637 domain-containing protein [Streptomyces sp. G-5]QQN76724.1 DUF2637 domain-containing protein [Streptomyces sp. XC 2026]
MTDIEFSWVIAGAVLLAGALVAVTLMSKGRKPAAAAADGVQSDSWEVMEERRRRKERAYATASYLLLFCCAGVAAALSFQGLVGFGRENLNLSGGWEYLVPFGLDGAAMFCAVIAVREASQGDASLGSRMLVWLFAGAAAWFNWVHAPRGEMHAGAPQFFAGMSLSAAILFDRALKQTRKAALREQGLVPRPLPQIRFVRWMRAPRETYGAWSLMLLENVRTLDEAVEEVREERRTKELEKARRKEQRKLEKARIKALGRQQRVEVAVEQAGGDRTEPAALESGQAPGGRRALDAPGSGGTATATAASSRTDLSGADGRLNSLEEKLAQIERQFG